MNSKNFSFGFGNFQQNKNYNFGQNHSDIKDVYESSANTTLRSPKDSLMDIDVPSKRID